MAKSLYIHIPFCNSICSYCDFCKLIYNDKFAFSYVKELKNEIEQYGKVKYSTIYLGGGTPSSLTYELLDDLLSFLDLYINKDNCEYTIEVNPESVTEDKLKLFKMHGINRISIGMQTTDKEYLKMLNRCDHSVFVSSFNLVKKYFYNINVDLMYALPNENNSILINDLNFLLSLKPNHISTYSLILENNSVFGKKGIKETDQDIQANQYELILEVLKKAGYKRYEVSNYCLKGYESKHNLTYWHDEEYVGCGLGASGYLNNKRYTNTKSLTKYLEHEYCDSVEEIDINSDIKYYLLTNLRLETGFSLDEFSRKFKKDFIYIYKDKLDKLIEEGLINIQDNWIKATDRGILLLDRILVELF